MGRRTISGRTLILITGCVGALLLTIWIPIASVSARQETPVLMHQALTTRAQVTPTVDPTVTALQKENLQHQNNWLWTNGGTLLSVLAIIVTALFGLYRWRRDQLSEQEKRTEDQRIEREKRDEERFQAVVAGLGSERVEAKVGGAIMLRTFLQEGYEQFYTQAFDLAVVHLRLRKADPHIPEPLDSLSQALITVLKESFPLARKLLADKGLEFDPALLDASRIHLDNAYLSQTDLSEVHMRHAYLREAHFWKARLEKANFKHSDLTKAFLEDAHLEEADLGNTKLMGAKMKRAHLQGIHLALADLTGADLTGTHPEDARSLTKTILRGVKGLNQVQLDACAAKGAIL